MSEEQFVGALTGAFSGNQVVAILVALSVNLALGILRALIEKSFSWEKLPGILEKSLPILGGYAAVSVVSSSAGGNAQQTINYLAAAAVVLRYALPILRDGNAILKDIHSPITLNRVASTIAPISVGSLVTHPDYKGVVLQVKERKGDKTLITHYIPGGGEAVTEVSTKDLSPI